MKRRVEFIMVKNKKAGKIGTVAAILASVILSGTTVFAYTPMRTTEVADSAVIPQTASFREDRNLNNMFLNSNIYFEADDHTIFPVTESDLEPRAIICTHVFKSGYSDLHYPNSNGGCTVKTYTAKVCQKCGHLVIMDLVTTATYTKCIHK